MKSSDPDPPSLQQLDEDIQLLEAKLAKLRLQRRKRFGSLKDWNMGDPFFVDSPDELTLDAIPDLARVILDALPVSVFIKEAQVREFGRRFRYISLKARRLTPGKWNELEVRDKDDSKAFYHEFASKEYQRMLKQETETLDGKASRQTLLEWKPTAHFWRRAKTYEIPIFLKSDTQKNNPIGFCAIAQEDERLVVPYVHSWLRRVFQHEYNNVCVNAKLHILQVESFLKSLLGSTQSPNASAINARLQDLNNAKKHLTIYGRTHEAIQSAFAIAASADIASVKDLCDDLNAMYKNGPNKIRFDMTDEAAGGNVRMGAAVKGAVVALIANAVKHSKPQLATDNEISVTVSRSEKQIIWDIRNRGIPPQSEMELMHFEEYEALKQANPEVEVGLTPVILGEMLWRAFQDSDWESVKQMFKGPNDAGNGWVKVTLSCENVKS